MSGSPYDELASVYDRWILGDPARSACHNFYVEWCNANVGDVVELGVGTGEIAIPLALAHRRVVGIDISEPMLSECGHKARRKGVSSRLSLCRMNILQLGLRDVETMLLPFRTIGHFTEFELRRKVFEQVWQSLRPGGRFVLDHYIPDPIWAKEVAGKSKIMFESPAGEENLRISDTYTFDIARGMMDCSVRVESSAAVAKVCTHDIEFDFAWVDTSEMREHALATQFKICATYGSFARAELTPTSTEQIWILQRPD